MRLIVSGMPCRAADSLRPSVSRIASRSISSYTPSPWRTSRQAMPAEMDAGLPAIVPAW
ncbi:hypothetical protein D3C71_1896110 [compost metagenome]